jgi:hypothetical protein
MGTKFFAPHPFTAPNMNMQARAQGAGSYLGRADAQGAAKALSNAMALYKAHGAKPMTGTAAYPKGPKGV